LNPSNRFVVEQNFAHESRHTGEGVKCSRDDRSATQEGGFPPEKILIDSTGQDSHKGKGPHLDSDSEDGDENDSPESYVQPHYHES
jgi:hypothetical protein